MLVVALGIPVRGGRAGHQLGDGMGDGANDVVSQLNVFPGVFFLEAEALLLGHVGPANVFDLLRDVQEHLLRTPVALESKLALAHVPPGHIGGAVDGEGDAVRHLLPPTLGVQARVVPGLLAGVDVNPSFLMVGIHFGPDMVLHVPHPANAASDGAAEHAEAVGPLADAASPGMQQAPYVAVAGKPFKGAARCGGAPVQLDAQRAAGTLVRRRCGHTLGNGGRQTNWAGGVVDPGEELPFEPPRQARLEHVPLNRTASFPADSPQERTNDAVLVAPGGLPTVSHTFCLCLHDLAFLLGLAVYPVQGDALEGLV